MGYEVKASARLPPPKPTEQEAAVQAVKNMEAMEMIHKLCYNTAVQPKEEKFRRVRLSNPKIKAVIGDLPAAVEAMVALGWQLEEADGEPVLVVPAGKYVQMPQVRIVEAARDKLLKDMKDSARHATAQMVA